MTWRRLGCSMVVALVAATSPAGATASLTCDAGDRVLTFDLMAAVGHEELTLSAVRGTLQLKGEGRTFELGGEELMQTWIESDDLRLRFYLFPEADRPEVDFVVVTRRKGDTAYTGSYRLKVARGKGSRRGEVRCVLG